MSVDIAKKNQLLLAGAALLLIAAVAGYWSMNKIKTQHNDVSLHCQAGTPGCATTVATATPSSHTDAIDSRTHIKTCAPEDQACDMRTQEARTIAYRNLRDRHSERD